MSGKWKAYQSARNVGTSIRCLLAGFVLMAFSVCLYLYVEDFAYPIKEEPWRFFRNCVLVMVGWSLLLEYVVIVPGKLQFLRGHARPLPDSRMSGRRKDEERLGTLEHTDTNESMRQLWWTVGITAICLIGYFYL